MDIEVNHFWANRNGKNEKQIGCTHCLFDGLLLDTSNAALSPEEKSHVPELTESPKIDGVLDNPIWEQQSLKIENFTQFAPEQKKDTHTKNAGLFGLRSKKICILPSAVMKPIGKK